MVRGAFAAWAIGHGPVFHLLADDATWIITGSAPIAGTPTTRFLEQEIQPLSPRLGVIAQYVQPTDTRPSA